MGIISYPELAYIIYPKEVRDIFHKYNKQIKAFCVMNKSRKSKYLLVTNELYKLLCSYNSLAHLTPMPFSVLCFKKNENVPFSRFTINFLYP